MQKKPTPAAGVTISIDEHGIVFFDLASGRLYRSNRVAAHIWQAVEQGLSVEDISVQLASQHRLDEPTVRDHVSLFVAELGHHGLVDGLTSQC
jgi:hypothetical protein